MEFIFEFIAELILEGSIEISSNKKVSKWIRYPLIFILILVFSIVIFGLLILGLIILNKNILAGIFIIIVSIIMLIGSIFKFKYTYLKKSNEYKS